MLTQLEFQNFKSWKRTENIHIAPLTGFFGTNSSGKTSILQFLLMLKQTVESSDRQRVLHTGDDKTYVYLGTYYDISHRHELAPIDFSMNWTLPKPLKIIDPESSKNRPLFTADALAFQASIALKSNNISVNKFQYSFQHESSQYAFGMQRQVRPNNGQTNDDQIIDNLTSTNQKYELVTDGYEAKRVRGRGWALPKPIKTYGFPDQSSGYYQNTGFLSDFVLAFEELFHDLYYLGPLREYPNRSYAWAGERPQDVGRRGELAVQALLASRSLPKLSRGRGRKKLTVEEMVAKWLKELGLIDEFRLEEIAENRKDYEVKVRRKSEASEALITDVGFGVSQILPVLVLCYYAPPGSTIVLEQPEIHLHPSIQAGLADVFIDAIKTRRIQIIVESHSEHLLRRLQRRIAESEEITNEETALYFCDLNKSGQSVLTNLNVDPYGNISNWPDQFFGDEMGELIKMAEAAMNRKMSEEAV